MLVRAPFTYGATVLRPRKRNHDEVRYRDHVDVVVPETTPEDAPLVLQGAEDSMGEIPPHRFHDGSLWKPSDMRGGHSSIPGAGPMRADLATSDAHDVSHPLHGSDGYGSRDHSAVTYESDRENVRHMRESTRAVVMDAVVAAAKDLLLVGDEVWVRAVEPVFGIHRSFNGDHVTIEGWDPKKDQYRLDLGHLIAAAEGQSPDAGRAYRRGMSDYAPPEVNLLRPDLLRARTTEHAARDAARRLVDAMAERLKEAGEGDLVAYATTRDELRSMTLDMVEGRGCDTARLLVAFGKGVDLLERISGNEERKARDLLRNVTVRIVGDPTITPALALSDFTA